MIKRKGFVHIVLVFVITLVAALMVGAAWFFERNKEEVGTSITTSNTNMANINVTNVNTNSPSNTNGKFWGTTANNRIYQNEKYNFSFQPPADLFIYDYTQQVSNALQNIYFNNVKESKLGDYNKTYLVLKVSTTQVPVINGKKLYLDTLPTETRTINSKDFDIYTFSRGYEGTPPFIVARYYAEDFNIEFAFWNTDSLSIKSTHLLDSLQIGDKQADSDIYSTNGENYIPDNWKKITLSDTEEELDGPHSNFTNQTILVTDTLVNQYTGERYFIEREMNSDYCGPNGGTSICNLMKENKNGNRDTIADLWFPEPGKTPDGEDYLFRKYGAKLVSFIDADTLQLFFSAVDHGGGFSEIDNYSLSKKTLTPLLKYYQTEGSDPGDYTILWYSFIKDEQTLTFINYNIPIGTEFQGYGEGVFLHTKGGKIKELHFPSGPYSIIFDISKNLIGNLISLDVNGVGTKIDMSGGEFEYIE